MIGRAVLALVLAHVASGLKTEEFQASDLEQAFVALHVKLHNTAGGLREQLKTGEMRKAPVLPLLVKFNQGLEQILSDTVYMKDKRAALVELRSADSSVEQILSDTVHMKDKRAALVEL